MDRLAAIKAETQKLRSTRPFFILVYLRPISNSVVVFSIRWAMPSLIMPLFGSFLWLLMANLESLSNPFPQPLSKRKTYSSAYSLTPPKQTQQRERVRSKQGIEDFPQKPYPSNTQPPPTADSAETTRHKRQSLPKAQNRHPEVFLQAFEEGAHNKPPYCSTACYKVLRK